MAVWKGAAEWGAVPHGDGSGDPLEGNIGDGGANFDPIWAGFADGVGNLGQNVVSTIPMCDPGVIAFVEKPPTANGWRMRFCETEIWVDGPGVDADNRFDIQGVMTHEYGHSLGLAHSALPSATMNAFIDPGANSRTKRSIEPDDIAGIQCIYGTIDPTKPRITGVSAAGGNVTIDGLNFDLLDNEVWFTPDATTAEADESRSCACSAFPRPAGPRSPWRSPRAAGPGEVMVRIPGTGNVTVSNAYPTDLGMVAVPPASVTFRNGAGVKRDLPDEPDPAGPRHRLG